jgi:nicotinate-nucleotide adenylyltransferase
VTGGRVGVFGGAFDPPHIGHLVVAQDVFEFLQLDLLLVVPTARPPHRGVQMSGEQRLELTRAAFGGDSRMRVSDIELNRPGPSWSVRTLESIRDALRPERLWLVIGADQYGSFDSWHQPVRILELAELAVLPRDGASPRIDPRYPCTVVPATRVDVSSTRIRERLDAGLGARYLVPESIRERLEQIWWQARPDGAPASTVSAGPEKDAGDGC